MKMYRARIQTAQILAGTLTAEFDINQGSDLPENIHVTYKVSAMSGSEVMDITGRCPGQLTLLTAVLATQIDLKAGESTVVALDLSGKHPLNQLLFTATNIAAAETVDITVITW
jgi:hypothetical protein